MLSCTMSSADSSLRTWYRARLKARFSALLRNSLSSRSVANLVQFVCSEAQKWDCKRWKCPFSSNYRINKVGCWLEAGARCDNLALQHQKANGSLLGADSVRLWLWPQVLTQLHKCLRKGTQGISLEKFTKVHHGNYICPWGV